ncbi:YcjF family protein [Magnetococcus sp. PR-3]|uniref:YcjF family protein n=1 Tax=Magnetococcus sp. PR-3 TaxID=3120355 RepID=UPI002FCE1682
MATDTWARPVMVELSEQEAEALKQDTSAVQSPSMAQTTPETNTVKTEASMPAHAAQPAEPQTTPQEESSWHSNVVQNVVQGSWDDTLPERMREAATKPVEITKKMMQYAAAVRAPRGGLLSWRSFALALLLFFAALMVENAVLFLDEQYQYSMVLGVFFSILAGLMVTSVSWWAFREWRLYAKQKDVTRYREKSLDLMQRSSSGEAQPLLDKISRLYANRPEMRYGLVRYQETSTTCLTDGEMLTAYSHEAMSALDSQACSIVVRHAATSSLMTAISPIAILDAAIFIWRNTKMMREVAQCYGFRPGFGGTMSLMSYVAQGLVGAGTSELMVDGASDAMGDSLASVFAARAGQGLLGGVFTARVGIHTMRYCRPIPFDAKTNPTMGRMRKELVSAVKGALKSKS